MQASGIITGQHFGYVFGLGLLPAAFLYSRDLLVAAPVAVAMGLAVTAPLDFGILRAPTARLIAGSRSAS